jgi:hypothetical protein
MGYLPGFEDDVLISYAHNDDDCYGPEARGWVAQLHIDLAERIKTYQARVDERRGRRQVMGTDIAHLVRRIQLSQAGHIGL